MVARAKTHNISHGGSKLGVQNAYSLRQSQRCHKSHRVEARPSTAIERRVGAVCGLPPVGRFTIQYSDRVNR